MNFWENFVKWFRSLRNKSTPVKTEVAGSAVTFVGNSSQPAGRGK